MDMITGFILGRTFLSTSHLCYDYTKDILYNKNNKSKQYIKVLNGKFVTVEQGGRSVTELVPVCSTFTHEKSHDKNFDKVSMNINNNTLVSVTHENHNKVNFISLDNSENLINKNADKNEIKNIDLEVHHHDTTNDINNNNNDGVKIIINENNNNNITSINSIQSSLSENKRDESNITDHGLDGNNRNSTKNYINNTNTNIENSLLNNNNTNTSDNRISNDAIKYRKIRSYQKRKEIIDSIKSHVYSDNCKHLTDDMKHICVDHMIAHLNDFAFIDNQHTSTYQNNNTVTVENSNNDHKTFNNSFSNEYIARLNAYLKAESKTAKDSSESHIILDQVMKILNDNAESYEENDPVMKNINNIDDLAAPAKIIETSELKQNKINKIKEMVNENNYLLKDQKEKLINELVNNMSVYSLNGENFQQTNVVEHEIHLDASSKPFHQRLRTYSPALQDIIYTEVNKMIDDKIIVKSNSPYASNLLLVRKPDPTSPGGVKNRVCVNFIQLNKITIKDRYPLPNQEEIFQHIGGSKYFSNFDLMSGFWQIAIKPEHRHKTAFITTRGLYEFLVMPFGLCNAPSTFQRMMDIIIKPEWRAFVQTYIDDIILYSKTFDEHISHLSILHKAMKENKLTVKLPKCHFAQPSVKFLGHIVSAEGIKPNPEKVEAIKKWSQPTDVTAVRSFCGMVGWYRKFIPHFSEISYPLYQLTRKNIPFIFDENCVEAFNTLRDALITAPILKSADFSKDFVISSDASHKALGVVLQQYGNDGILYPIAYASKTLNPAQINYSTTEKECLALVWGLEHFKTYCEGHSYTCITDHKALTYLVGNKECPNNRITRWILRLQPYNLKVNYIKGADNHAADLLSRPDLMLYNNIHFDSNNIYINGITTRGQNNIYRGPKIVYDYDEPKRNTRPRKQPSTRSTRAHKPLPTFDVEIENN
jgi:hypothetical protein